MVAGLVVCSSKVSPLPVMLQRPYADWLAFMKVFKLLQIVTRIQPILVMFKDPCAKSCFSYQRLVSQTGSCLALFVAAAGMLHVMLMLSTIVSLHCAASLGHCLVTEMLVC